MRILMDTTCWKVHLSALGDTPPSPRGGAGTTQPPDAEARGCPSSAGGLGSRPILEKAGCALSWSLSLWQPNLSGRTPAEAGRQAPFLSVSQEPRRRGVERRGTIRLSEADGGRRGEEEAAVLLQGPGGHKLPEWSLIHPPTVPVLTLPPTWCALPPLVLGLAGGWRAPSCQSCHTIYLLPFPSRIGPCLL